MNLHETPWLRRLMLPIFAQFNVGDITIRHHHTGDQLSLHSFRHKGYWFHGRHREAETMGQFAALIAPGDTVFEVGGHIGYISLYLAKLVGESGFVHVFEPGPNNLPYLRRNAGMRPNIIVEPVGVGRAPGTLPFYVEGLTGQNNSFVPDFAGLRQNEAAAHLGAAKAVVEVPVVTLDDYARSHQSEPAFVKVDVEGFELDVLLGMKHLLETRAPRLMVEVQSSEAEIRELLGGLGYLTFTPDGTPVTAEEGLTLNTLFIHRNDHAGLAAVRKTGGRMIGTSPAARRVHQ